MRKRLSINILNFVAYLLLISILFLPKINIVQMMQNSTGVRIEDFLLLIWVVLYLFIKKEKNSSSIEIKKISKIFWIYLLVCVLSTFINSVRGFISPVLGLFFTARKIEYFVYVYIGYYCIKNEKNKNILMKILKISIIFHFVVIFLQSFGIVGAFTRGNFISDMTDMRPCSTFNGAYELSAYLLLLVPLIMEKIKVNKFNILYLVMIFISIYLSESRTSIVCLFLILLIYWILDNKNDMKKIIKGFLVIFISVITFINLDNIIGYIPRMENINISGMIESSKIAWEYADVDHFLETGKHYTYGLQTIDLSFRVRANKWADFLKATLRYPLFGIGPSIVKVSIDGNYIRLLAEAGILGFILYMKLLFVIYKYVKNNDGIYSKIIKYGFYSLLLEALFIDVFEASKIMMPFFFITGVALYYIESTKEVTQ